MTFNWIVSQIGSRELYSIPRCFDRHGRLVTLYTDAWCRYGQKLIRKLPLPYSNFSHRYHEDLPPAKVVSFTIDTTFRQMTTRRARSLEEQYDQYIDIGKHFAEKVNRKLEN